MYEVSTIHGIVSLNLRYPGLYDDSYPNDFDGVKELVCDKVNILYQRLRRQWIVFALKDPILTFQSGRLIASIDSNLPTPPDAVGDIRAMLTEVHRDATMMVAGRVMDRLNTLGAFAHSFEKLAQDARTGGLQSLSDPSFGTSVTIASDTITFQQEFPLVIIKFKPAGGLAAAVELSLEELGDQFNWTTMFEQITKRTGTNASLPTLREVSKKAKLDGGNYRLKFWMSQDGGLLVRCTSKEMTSWLIVSDRDPMHAFKESDKPGRTIDWEGVLSLCEMMEKALIYT